MPQKCVGGRGSVPDPAGGAYSAPPDLLAGFGWEREGDMKREKRGEERKGGGEKGSGV